MFITGIPYENYRYIVYHISTSLQRLGRDFYEFRRIGLQGGTLSGILPNGIYYRIMQWFYAYMHALVNYRSKADECGRREKAPKSATVNGIIYSINA